MFFEFACRWDYYCVPRTFASALVNALSAGHVPRRVRRFRSAFSSPCRWRIIGRYLFDPRWPNSECMVPWQLSGRHSRPGFGRTSHEIVVKFCRALSCRIPINCIILRPERYGNVANSNRRCLPTSEHHGRCAEAGGKVSSVGGKATKARSGRKHSSGGKHRRSSPDIHSNAIVCARFSDGEACRA